MKKLLVGLLALGSISAYSSNPYFSIKCSNSAIDATKRNLSVNMTSNCGLCHSEIEFVVTLKMLKNDGSYDEKLLQKALESLSIKNTTKSDFFTNKVTTIQVLNSNGKPVSQRSKKNSFEQISHFDALLKDQEISDDTITVSCVYKSIGKSFTKDFKMEAL